MCRASFPTCTGLWHAFSLAILSLSWSILDQIFQLSIISPIHHIVQSHPFPTTSTLTQTQMHKKFEITVNSNTYCQMMVTELPTTDACCLSVSKCWVRSVNSCSFYVILRRFVLVCGFVNTVLGKCAINRPLALLFSPLHNDVRLAGSPRGGAHKCEGMLSHI